MPDAYENVNLMKERHVESLYFLVPLAAIIALIIVGILFWATKSGQFDDLEGPAHRILLDDDEQETLEYEQRQREKNDQK